MAAATNTNRPMTRVRQCCLHIGCIFILIVIVLALSCSLVYAMENDGYAGSAMPRMNMNGDEDDVAASDSDTPDNTIPTQQQQEQPPPKKTEPISPDGEDDWGNFYDPNNVFCGKFDCYKILGFDYETWGSSPPSLKDITKSYRGLSRKWHPDKNKAKGAREKFVVSLCFCVCQSHYRHFYVVLYVVTHSFIYIYTYCNIGYCQGV